MNYEIITRNNQNVLIIDSIQSNKDLNASDIISVSFELGTDKLILDANAITENFTNLRTGLAGDIIQKLINYNITAAAVIKEPDLLKDRFKELILEYNKGVNIRFYPSLEEAISWLVTL